MQRKSTTKAIAYLIIGILLYMFILYRTTNIGDLVSGFTMPPIQYWAAVGIVGFVFFSGVITVWFNRGKLTTFYLARAIGFWLIQIPLLSMFSFLFMQLVFGIDDSQEWLVWAKAMVPPTLLFVSIISAYVKNWRGHGSEELAKKFDVMANTAMRIMSWALIISFTTGIAGPYVNYNKSLYIVMMTLQWTGTIAIHTRNGFKIVKEKYDNVLFGWIDPALPHSTLIAVFWWVSAGMFGAAMQSSIGLRKTVLINNSVGLGLQGLMVTVHVLFKVSLWKILIQDNPIFTFYNEAFDKEQIKLKDLNPWKLIKNYLKYRRINIDKRKLMRVQRRNSSR